MVGVGRGCGPESRSGEVDGLGSELVIGGGVMVVAVVVRVEVEGRWVVRVRVEVTVVVVSALRTLQGGLASGWVMDSSWRVWVGGGDIPSVGEMDRGHFS
jgi:hypothetical protein